MTSLAEGNWCAAWWVSPAASAYTESVVARRESWSSSMG